jgi:hypothetical protein
LLLKTSKLSRFTLLRLHTIKSKIMKTKIALFSLLAVAMSASVFAQEEIDDMYFTSKDRVAENAKRQVEVASLSKRVLESESAPVINPTDSYSSRGVNPEYISGSKVGSVATTGNNVSYFSANYQPTAVNQSLNNNSNMAYNGFGGPMGYNRFGSPYGMMGGMGMMGMGGMGMGFSPWGFNNMGMMNPYMNPYMDPFMMNNWGGYGMNGFYQPGLSFGFGSGWGNPMFGFGNSFYNPWGYNSWGMNSFYGGWGNPWGWNSFYGNNIVIADQPRRQSARASEMAYYSQANSSTSGRVATTDYYNSTWRNVVYQQANTNAQNNGWSNGGWNVPRNNNNSWNNGWQNNNGWNNNSWNNSNGSWGGRSSSFSTGGGTSGGGYSGGSSGGGSRRGRD